MDKMFEELKELLENLRKSFSKDSSQNGENINETPEIDIENQNVTILIEKLNNLIESSADTENENYKKLLVMKASVFYEQAKFLANAGNILRAAQKLEKAFEVVSEQKDHCQIKYFYLRLINHRAYLMTRLNDLQHARELLESVCDFEANTDITVYSTEELFSGKTPDKKNQLTKLNKLLAHNLQMLGWIYGRMGLYDEYAVKIHKSLEKQLEIEDLDSLDWVCKCTKLCTLLISRQKWVTARYHLSVATTILYRLEKELINHSKLTKTQGDLARCWVYYGIQLFSWSTFYLTQKISGNTTYTQEEALDENMIFKTLDVTVETVPANPIAATEPARLLFLRTNTWLKKSRLYYTLRDFPLQYINSVLDLSELYRYMAFYEPDLDSIYTVQKRRSDALETLIGILKEVRPQCYILVNIELTRELAEVQIELLSLNLRKLYFNHEVNYEPEDRIRRKLAAVSDIHSRLDGLDYNVYSQVNRFEKHVESRIHVEPEATVKSEDTEKKVETTADETLPKPNVATVEEANKNDETSQKPNEISTNSTEIAKSSDETSNNSSKLSGNTLNNQ